MPQTPPTTTTTTTKHELVLQVVEWHDINRLSVETQTHTQEGVMIVSCRCVPVAPSIQRKKGHVHEGSYSCPLVLLLAHATLPPSLASWASLG